jgi:hypothetical protein
MRKPSGDENRKGTNLHNAVCITDEFMQAVRDDQPFDLLARSRSSRSRRFRPATCGVC